MKVNVIYEEDVQLNIQKSFDLAMQWLRSQHKAKVKISKPHTFIEAKQGTMMANTGHNPNWKKRIKINFNDLDGAKTLIRVEAMPLARNIFRVDKLKQSWYDGLFSHLFSLLLTYRESSKLEETLKPEIIQGSKLKYCTYCGKKIDESAKLCPSYGVDIK